MKKTLFIFVIFLFFITNSIYSQINFKINEVKVSHIIETIDYGHIIEGTFGNGPKIRVFCEISNNSNDTVILDLKNYELSILFNYSDKKYIDEITKGFNDPFVGIKENIKIMPHGNYSFYFRTSYLFGTDFFKDTYPIVDCTKEVIETLPTLKVRYKDTNLDITTNEILKVTIENFVFRWE